ncbi:hypothetical protein GPECTOR_3g365 [Gonium pectorale]|uniref:Uncharacterized protein n=1 Tax=Gonium pectorale TaxID=33097 RepID=A0A150GZP2_GONPE|nr:hypothetical protein GPECTOR_3g365 [Gonium pectorale]|eukprot:KXZ55223.1 hypothetical protein GPECTOR_3g365 [Gonium pectorale]
MASSSSPASTSAASASAAAALPPSLRAFLSPPPAALLMPFAASRHLTHLALVDLSPGPAERDLAALAAAFPALASLHLLACPGSPARYAVPPLWPLRACARLRALSLDLGRGSVMGAGARASLGCLTQLRTLVLGLADAGGGDGEDVCCGTGGLAQPQGRPLSHHHHHHVYCPGGGGGGGGEGGMAGAAAVRGEAVVAAAVGGVEASLFCLAAAGLASLELRVVSFGAFERRLVQAVAAGGAAASSAADTCLGGAKGGGGGGGTLQHLSVRLMAAQHHATSHASYSAPPSPYSLASAAGGCGCGAGDGSSSAASGAGGFCGSDGAPAASASLDFNPVALRSAASGGGGAVWAQPSEAERMLASLPALTGLTRLEVPELLMATCGPLSCLSALSRLTELRVGGVVASGVAAPAALGQLSLTLQYGGDGGGVGGPGALGWQVGGAAATGPLAAALARVPHVRLAIVMGEPGGGGGVFRAPHGCVAAGGGGFTADADGGAIAALRRELPSLLWGSQGSARRHLELRASDPAELLASLDPSLLAGAGAEEDDGGMAGVEMMGARLVFGRPTGRDGPANANGGCGGGVETLRLVSGAGPGWRVGMAVAAAAADRLCGRAAAVVERASRPLGCLCCLEPWVLEAGAVGRQAERAAAKSGRIAPGSGPGSGPGAGSGLGSGLDALVRAAGARGTRLCLCRLGSAQRSGLLHALERQGLDLTEGRCGAL